MVLPVLTPPGWRDYELLDSGDGAKLERWGRYLIQRPETAALWHRTLSPKEWGEADAVFERSRGSGGGGSADAGQWYHRHDFEEPWPIRWQGLTVHARLTPFRHTGIFPEQAAHWTWLEEQLGGPHPSTPSPVGEGETDASAAAIPPSPRGSGGPGGEVSPRVLNLFGYTGLATLVAARAGAAVVHVDASRKAIGWARENAEASGLADRPVRWILDDALKFVKREVRRHAHYDAIVLDPPAFGRGPSGEIWRFEEGVPVLLAFCRELLGERARCLILTAYAVTASALLLRNLLESQLGDLGGTIEAGELAIPETATGRLLPTAIYARWRREA